MQLNNSFTVSATPEVAWNVLLDVPRIAPCMPGAELTEVVGENTYKGNAKLRVGPVNLTFSGEAEITEMDEASRTATVHAKGNDTKGRGAAEADVVFELVEDGGQTRVDITTELNLTGTVAQYGRASGLIDAIAGQIISDFAKNLEAEIGTDAAPAEVSNEASLDVAPRQADQATLSDNSISGISLFFRAIWAMIRGKR
ncbi:MAG: SRPBCC family protein [Alphaproteobacteria bacterium]|jgi:carbon monoxide dehydrogenase subunit G|nr:SRPBCC family protein [Alphaproteobacteria bacterium]